jgi:hypothetical protein
MIEDITGPTRLLAILALIALLTTSLVILPSSATRVSRASAPRMSFAPLPILQGANFPLSAYAVMSEKPLFNTDRKPDPLESDAKAKVPPLSDYRLVGVVIVKADRLALIERRKAHQTVTVRPGDALDGRHVDDIGVSGVRLSGENGAEFLVIPKASSATQR